MQNWEEHAENHERFVKSCLDELATRRSRPEPLPTGNPPVSYFPMQTVEKMRLRISSAVVAPVMASIGPSAL
jgi:hypothetical protein